MSLPEARRMMYRSLLRLLIPACIGLVFISSLTMRSAAASSRVVFHFYDSSGKQLQWSSFRALQENGKGNAGDNDALLDPRDLAVISMWPLYSDSGSASGNPVFDWPGKEASLSLAWPTSDGYSNLVIDVPGPGTYDFTYLAAQQEVSALDSAVAARSSYRPSTTFTTASNTAHAQLSAARSATTESQEGAHGAQALDAAVHAMTTLYSEYGIQCAKSSRSTFRPQWGVTFDTIAGGTGDLSTVRDLVGSDPQDGWVRIVFDRAKGPSYYANEISAAHQAGLHVVGQLLDSSDMSKGSLRAWKSRVRSYVSALPTVDEWEIGNEVNGNWLGSNVVPKITYAANYVKTHTSARTLLTLYWQLGEDNAAHSMYTWAERNLSSSLLSQVDDLGISLYPEDHPMAVTFDRAFSTLHSLFPSQRIEITELGYWSTDLGHTWWWGSQTDGTGTGRQAVASLYQAAVMGYSYSGGGAYWWYYLEEALPKNALWSTLARLHNEVATA